MIGGTLTIDSGTGPRQVSLSDYLEPASREAAAVAANDWIKALRHAVVDGQPMRRRFTYRGDSLWWFTELYLHKTQTIEKLFRTIIALEHLVERERPFEMRVVSGERLLRGLAPQIARARRIRFGGRGGFGATWPRLLRLNLRARALTGAALASRLRGQRASSTATMPIAVFVHRAFWTAGWSGGGAESYIGPVLSALEQQAPAGSVHYIGVGPSENFAARRWWRPGAGGADNAMTPIESFAPLSALRGSRAVWRMRRILLRTLWRSDDLRARASIRGCDCWPVVREELAGVALLQWPWSARAMDEAAAALEAAPPRVAVTYAEAGGWGRALMLECRRKNVPTVGLQHGFIYRHWLNYRHEPDEMRAPDGDDVDAGFPRPTVTLLFDAYAARHLEDVGRFPASALAVTGSARLDALAAATRIMTEEDLRRTRQEITGSPDGDFVLVVTKFREVRAILPSLIIAAGALPDVYLAIKTHPAETPALYAPLAAGAARVRVLPAAAPLAALLRSARAVATVNSTVALDAAALGIPALVMGLPNNLSPFVEAGVMAGGSTPQEIAALLRKILYDKGFRQQLADDREAFLQQFGMRPDGHAAERAAQAVLRLMEDNG